MYIDHKPLKFALSFRSDKHSHRTFRHFDCISQFTSDIHQISGAKNAPAGALSRLLACSILPLAEIDLSFTVQDQPALNTLNLTSSKWSCCKCAYLLRSLSEGTIICDTATGSPRPLAPANYQRSMFDVLHSFSHLGISASVKQVMTRSF